MSEQTKIAWCDSTVNFWEGCTKVSAGCANCYAEARNKRFNGVFVGDYGSPKKIAGNWGVGAPRRKSKSAVKDALAFNRKPWVCNSCGEAFASQSGHTHITSPDSGYSTFHRRRVFSLSLGDWLDDEVPIAWLAEMLDTIRQCDQVTWILCSKRWDNWRDRLTLAMQFNRFNNCSTHGPSFPNWCNDWLNGNPPANIIGLCSVENQEAADSRIPQFLTVPLACRGLSLEPLLGAVNLREFSPFNVVHGMTIPENSHRVFGGIDWLIIGGESGANARPCNVDWIRSIVQQGKAAGVTEFVKQLGAKPFIERASDGSLEDFDVRAHWENKKMIWDFADKKGGDPAEWPADLRVQAWPKGF